MFFNFTYLKFPVNGILTWVLQSVCFMYLVRLAVPVSYEVVQSKGVKEEGRMVREGPG